MIKQKNSYIKSYLSSGKISKIKKTYRKMHSNDTKHEILKFTEIIKTIFQIATDNIYLFQYIILNVLS